MPSVDPLPFAYESRYIPDNAFMIKVIGFWLLPATPRPRSGGDSARGRTTPIAVPRAAAWRVDYVLS